MKRERRVRAPGRAIGHVMILVPTDGQVAQLVEHVTENHGVGGSIPSLATNRINHLQESWLAEAGGVTLVQLRDVAKRTRVGRAEPMAWIQRAACCQIRPTALARSRTHAPSGERQTDCERPSDGERALARTRALEPP